MAAEAKAPRVIDEDSRPVVLELHSKEGGVALGGWGIQSIIRTKGPHNPGIRPAIAGLAMRLDRALGGVEIRFLNKDGQAKRVLVPQGHIRCVELE